MLNQRPFVFPALFFSVLGCSGDPAPPDSEDRCALPETIIADRTLLLSCSPYALNESLRISGGATLFIEPGVELRFAQGRSLIVGDRSSGRLIALGTEEAPIVFSGQQPGAGNWAGIIIKGNTLPSTAFDHVRIEGGGAIQPGSRGCLTVDNAPAKTVAIERTTFSNCAQAGLTIRGSQPRAMGALRFEDSAVGLRLAPSMVAFVDAGFEYENVDANLIESGPLTESAIWIAQSIPWSVLGKIEVRGEAEPTLTLMPGFSARFVPGAWLRIGEDLPGSLLAEGTEDMPISLKSELTDPLTGMPPERWSGVVLQPFARAILSQVIIERGGRPDVGVRGCLTVAQVENGAVSVTNTRFVDCAQSGVGALESEVVFSDFSDNVFEQSDSGLLLLASSVGRIDQTHTFIETPYNLAIGGIVTRNSTWIAQSIPWRVRGSIQVQGTTLPSLTLSPGLVLHFERGGDIAIGTSEPGQLIAEGTEAQPVLLEPVRVIENGPLTPGSWRGITLGRSTSSGTRISHIELRGAGGGQFGALGCVTIDSDRAELIDIEDSLFEDCEQSGIAATMQTFRFKSLSNNRFIRMPFGLRMFAGSVGSITQEQSYQDVPANQIFGGDILEDATWSRSALPWRLNNSVRVSGEMAPVLTLAAGVELQFDEGAMMEIGLFRPGGLIAAGTRSDAVVFKSSKPDPEPASWPGLVFGPATEAGSSLNQAWVQHAGQDAPGVRGAVTLLGTENRVSVLDTTFDDNDKSDLFVDCGSNPTLVNNVYGSMSGLVIDSCKK